MVKSEGLPIPGATVKATQGERILLTVTDDNGDFHIDGMTEGTWIVEVDMFGFDHVRKEVQVGPTPAKIDLTHATADRTRQAIARQDAAAVKCGDANADDDLYRGRAWRASHGGPPDMPQPQVDAEASNESLLVTGSVSQGAGTNPGDFGPGGFPGRSGGFPGGPGGDLGEPGGPGGPGGRRGRVDLVAAGGGGPGGGGGGRGGGGGGRQAEAAAADAGDEAGAAAAAGIRRSSAIGSGPSRTGSMARYSSSSEIRY